MSDTLYLYRLSKRGIETHSEIVCQRHYDEMNFEGGFMGPLTERERLRGGLKQTITPYTGGKHECASCEQERGEMRT